MAARAAFRRSTATESSWRGTDGADHLLGLDAQDPHGSAVGADEARLEVLEHVGDRCLLVQVAIAPLALAESLLHAQPGQLRRRPRGEDAEDEDPLRVGLHRLAIERA
jgi:hypothetical protein